MKKFFASLLALVGMVAGLTLTSCGGGGGGGSLSGTTIMANGATSAYQISIGEKVNSSGSTNEGAYYCTIADVALTEVSELVMTVDEPVQFGEDGKSIVLLKATVSVSSADPNENAAFYNLITGIVSTNKAITKLTFPEGALKVLVAEDNPELRVYIYNNLADRYEVKDCANGMDALKTIEEGWVPDIVVTDLMMPRMDGMELISHLRNDFATSHIPILVVTAKHEDDTQVKAMKYGADGYIAKPFTMDLLIARIDNMLERRKALVSRMSSRKVDISPEEIVITDKDEQLIKKVMAWLEENVGDAEITVDQLVSHVGMGRTSMYNKIKGLTGKSPVELIQDFRLEKATYYLKSGQYSVSETSYKVGFSDPGYFSRSFKKHYGISPADYMKQNRK